jgi:hypothetical protein
MHQFPVPRHPLGIQVHLQKGFIALVCAIVGWCQLTNRRIYLEL